MATFDCSNSLDKFRKCFPEGRAFKEIYREGSNFYKLSFFFSKVFERLCKEINNTFDGFFLSESDYLLEYHKAEYSIPSDYLPNDNPDRNEFDNIVDSYVYEYLIHKNTKEDLIRVANAYGLRAKVKILGPHHVNVVLFHKIGSGFDYKFLLSNEVEDGVIYFGGERQYQKLLSFFYQKMKPAHVKLEVSIAEPDEIEICNYDPDEPIFSGEELNGEKGPPPIRIGGKIVKKRDECWED